MKYIPVVISLALCACASELHTTSQLDQATKSEATNQADATSHAEQHAQAADKIEDHGQERVDENIVTTSSGGAIDFVGVITKPDGTKLDGHFRRAPVKVKRDARKTDAVQKALTNDASSMFDAKEDAAAKSTGATKTYTTTKTKTEKEKKTKPSLGFLAALMPWLLGLGAVAVLIAVSWLTKTNPVALAGKVVLWAVAKLRGQPSAG